MLRKTQVAFLMTAQSFFEQNNRVYFWTLTFKEVYSDWRYLPKWHFIMNALVGGPKSAALCPGLQGIRVTEIHPGGHGLHFHLLVNRRIELDMLHQIGDRVGLGRCSVQLVRHSHSNHVANYLIKYMCKQHGQLTKGMRAWSTFGGFRGTKVRSVEIDSILHRNLRECYRGRQTTYALFFLCRQITEMYGQFKDWPNVYKLLVTPCNQFQANEDYMRKKIARQFIQCPGRPNENKIENIVFWSSNDARGWARLNGLFLVKTSICARCGAVHGEFSKNTDVVPAQLQPESPSRSNMQYVGNARCKELNEKHGRKNI
jgi:hypothetical protein